MKDKPHSNPSDINDLHTQGAMVLTRNLIPRVRVCVCVVVRPLASAVPSFMLLVQHRHRAFVVGRSSVCITFGSIRLKLRCGQMSCSRSSHDIAERR